MKEITEEMFNDYVLPNAVKKIPNCFMGHDYYDSLGEKIGSVNHGMISDSFYAEERIIGSNLETIFVVTGIMNLL